MPVLGRPGRKLRIVVSLISAIFLLVGLSRWMRRTPTAEAPRAPAKVPAPAKRPVAPPAPAKVEVRPAEATGLARISGTVRDALTRAPLGRVDVIFAAGAVETTATTGSDGSYALAVAAGEYRVRVVGDDVYGIPPEALRVVAGVDVRSYDLRAARLAWLGGRVVRPDGAPVAGAQISFRTAVPDAEVSSADLGPPGTAISAADGTFRVRVCPGAVTVLAEREAERGQVHLPWVRPAGKVDHVRIVVTAGSGVAGVVVDPDGAPVAGARVVAVVVRLPMDAPGGRLSAVTDGAGRYEIAPLSAGDVRVEADAPGFAAAVAVAAQNLKPGERRDGVDLMLQRALTVSGRVVDPHDAPVAGARVVAVHRSALPREPVFTDGNGNFSLTGINGRVLVVATKDGFAPARKPGVQGNTDGLVLKLGGFGVLTGRVSDVASGAPLADFTVRVEPGEPSRFLAPDGVYRLDQLEPATYDVIVSAPGHAPQRLRKVVVTMGNTTDASAALGAAATITGHVSDAANGNPLAGARIAGISGHEGEAVYTDADGSYTLPDVAPGRRSVSVEHAGYVVRNEGGLELRAGEAKLLDFALTALPRGSRPENAAPVELVGIGAMLGLDGERLTLRGFLPHGPAEAAGLQIGDELVSIDGVPSAGRPLPESIEAIRGIAGTTVRLEVRRKSLPAPFVQEVVRANVRFGG